MADFGFSSRGRKGASLVEYGLLAGLVAVAAIANVSTLGRTTKETFETVTATLSDNMVLATSGSSVGAVRWDDFSEGVVTAAEFSPAVMNSAAGWYGFYDASSEGTAIKKTGTPEMVGAHFNPASGGALHVNFASLNPDFIADNRIACRSEVNADIFSAELSSASEGSHAGYPYLRFAVASLPELDLNLVDLASPVPMLCEVLPR